MSHSSALCAALCRANGTSVSRKRWICAFSWRFASDDSTARCTSTDASLNSEVVKSANDPSSEMSSCKPSIPERKRWLKKPGRNEKVFCWIFFFTGLDKKTWFVVAFWEVFFFKWLFFGCFEHSCSIVHCVTWVGKSGGKADSNRIEAGLCLRTSTYISDILVHTFRLFENLCTFRESETSTPLRRSETNCTNQFLARRIFPTAWLGGVQTEWRPAFAFPNINLSVAWPTWPADDSGTSFCNFWPEEIPTFFYFWPEWNSNILNFWSNEIPTIWTFYLTKFRKRC